MGIPDRLTCLLRNLNAGQEATARTQHGKMDWFKIGKGICQGCILSPCLFNLYAELDTTEQLHFHFSVSCTREGNGNPLQCSSLENPRDGGAWWAAVYGVAESDMTEVIEQQQQHSAYKLNKQGDNIQP